MDIKKSLRDWGIKLFLFQNGVYRLIMQNLTLITIAMKISKSSWSSNNSHRNCMRIYRKVYHFQRKVFIKERITKKRFSHWFKILGIGYNKHLFAKVLGLTVNLNNILKRRTPNLEKIKRKLLIMNKNATKFKCRVWRKYFANSRMCFQLMENKIQYNRNINQEIKINRKKE